MTHTVGHTIWPTSTSTSTYRLAAHSIPLFFNCLDINIPLLHNTSYFSFCTHTQSFCSNTLQVYFYALYSFVILLRIYLSVKWQRCRFPRHSLHHIQSMLETRERTHILLTHPSILRILYVIYLINFLNFSN